MKKFAIVGVILLLFTINASAVYWDLPRVFAGTQDVNGFAIGDDGYLDFGADNNLRITYDATTNDRAELTMTAGGMYFDVTDITFYTDDPTNESLTFTGFVPNFADGLTAAEEVTFSASVVYTPYVNNTGDFTVGDNDYYTFHVGNATANQTVTLPTAADNAGRFLLFVITEDPGNNNFVLDGEGAETVGGAATKTCTDAVGSLYYIYCDGLAWRLVSSQGTWS